MKKALKVIAIAVAVATVAGLGFTAWLYAANCGGAHNLVC